MIALGGTPRSPPIEDSPTRCKSGGPSSAGRRRLDFEASLSQIPPEELEARNLGDANGVVMINFMGMALDPEKSTLSFILDLLLHGGGTDVSVSDVVDHIEHVVEVAGIEHVGLGSDADGSPGSFFPMGLRSVNVTLELLRRGYSDDEIQLILGENLLRVLGAAESARAVDARRGRPLTTPGATAR
jgi:hypothetical protein